MTSPRYETIRVRLDGDVCFLQLDRPAANNCINRRMIEECASALELCEARAKILVLEGGPEVFCLGADFQELAAASPDDPRAASHAEALYDLWTALGHGSFVSIAHVRGKVSAGGVGFVAACDIALCDATATFGLSELLFGLMPACVLPFLVRRIGYARANYLTTMTQPISAAQAASWQLVDGTDEHSANLLRKHLLRLRYLAKPAVARYKRYMRQLDRLVSGARTCAIAANHEVFGDPENLRRIERYVTTGQFPWEGD